MQIIRYIDKKERHSHRLPKQSDVKNQEITNTADMKTFTLADKQVHQDPAELPGHRVFSDILDITIVSYLNGTKQNTFNFDHILSAEITQTCSVHYWLKNFNHSSIWPSGGMLLMFYFHIPIFVDEHLQFLTASYGGVDSGIASLTERIRRPRLSTAYGLWFGNSISVKLIPTYGAGICTLDSIYLYIIISSVPNPLW